MNVPAFANVVVLLAPGVISPVSHRPLSLVDVCVMVSLFCQVMVVFLLTVIVAGLNAMPDIATVFGALGVGVGVGDGLVGL